MLLKNVKFVFIYNDVKSANESPILFYTCSKFEAFQKTAAQRFLSTEADLQDGGCR